MLNEQRLFKTTTINDPAIDSDAMGGAAGLVEWATTRDFGALRLKGGAQPVTFYLRTLGGLKAHRLIGTAPDEQEAFVRAFRACVVRVDNHAGFPSWEPVRVRDGGAELDGPTMTDTELDTFHISTIYEIGAAAHGLCFFPSATGRRFRLPLLSGQIWDLQNASRHADEPTHTGATSGTSDARPGEG